MSDAFGYAVAGSMEQITGAQIALLGRSAWRQTRPVVQRSASDVTPFVGLATFVRSDDWHRP